MIFSENIPIFVQIAERLSDEILAGNYAEGERVPSVREYSVLLEVNVNTTVKAYDLLSSRVAGWLHRAEGSAHRLFKADAFESALKHAGLVPLRLRPTCGGQILRFVVHKPSTTDSHNPNNSEHRT